MESRSTWKPIHHAISAIIEANDERSFLSYELVTQLVAQGFIKASVDTQALIEGFDEAIWKFEESLREGRAGSSLPMRLVSVIQKT